LIEPSELHAAKSVEFCCELSKSNQQLSEWKIYYPAVVDAEHGIAYFIH
jgi:hypothetical protein